MAKREVLGKMDCPECGMSGAEVKAQKTGLLYRWCPDCNAQYFPRTAEASERLGKKAGIGSGTGAAVAPSTVTDTETTPAIVPVQKQPARSRAGFDMGL